jgi:hypothetical protein
VSVRIRIVLHSRFRIVLHIGVPDMPNGYRVTDFFLNAQSLELPVLSAFSPIFEAGLRGSPGQRG